MAQSGHTESTATEEAKFIHPECYYWNIGISAFASTRWPIIKCVVGNQNMILTFEITPIIVECDQFFAPE